jgi:hypothetical protein
MSKIKVRPWKGETYEAPKILPYKTLILGESNYTDNPEKFDENIVIDCVLEDINGQQDPQGFGKFATKTRRVIFGRDTKMEPDVFWGNVAFYNFVQFLVGNQARQRPTEEMWVNSIPAFEELITELKPERILVLGLANWRNLIFHIAHQQKSEHSAILSVGTNSVLAGYINHPSSSITYSKWQPIAQALLLQ